MFGGLSRGTSRGAAIGGAFALSLVAPALALPAPVVDPEAVSPALHQARQGPRTRREPANRQEWVAALHAKITSRQRYPRALRRLRVEGQEALGSSIVRFVMDRRGRLSSLELAQSSGIPEADQAALDMVRRAAPLPRPPADVPDDGLTLSVPIIFR